jgi:surface antigen
LPFISEEGTAMQGVNRRSDRARSMPAGALETISLVLVVAVLASGCAQMGSTVSDNPKTAIGGLGGAAVGGLIAAAAGGGGTAIAASVIGGALLGGLAGNLLDSRDKRMAAESAQRALETAPSGQPVAWKNPDSGHSGTVTPTRTYQSGNTYCREYQQTVTIDGKPERSYGTACRQPDGSWKIQS